MIKGLTIVTMAMAAVGTISAGIMNWIVLYQQDPVSYTWITTDEDGKQTVACPAVVLDRPIINQIAVANFARDAVLSINHFTYLSWDVELPEALEAYFTPYAAKLYRRDFEGSRLLDAVQRNYYRSTAISTYPTVLVSETDAAGRREWLVQVPVVITYSTGNVQEEGTSRSTAGSRSRRSTYRIYTVRLVEQAPTHRNYRGVAVVDMTSVSVRGPQEFSKPKNQLNVVGGRL